MNPNAGRFIEEEKAKAWMQRIEVGEVVKIKGEELEIVEIGDRTLKLKLLSAQERLAKRFPVETDFNRHMRRQQAALERKMSKKSKRARPAREE